jgi:prepilin-type N-terminal cleavage/methylation domain-containing protein
MSKKGGFVGLHAHYSKGSFQRKRRERSLGFTLLEILLAVSILAIVSTVTFMTFAAATTAWQRGTALVDSLHHGDFVVQQLVMGLRSAYYPETGKKSEYGFVHEDNGDDASAEDTISWVKLGGALVGRNNPVSQTPHRVEFFLTDDEDGDRVAAVKAWPLQGQDEDFDPDDVPTTFLSKRVVGLNCRMAWQLDADGEIDWLDEWEDTNRIPTVVEISLYLEPAESGEDPVELKRVVGLRLGPLSWK